ncbi:MAG: hypothetical protein NWE99_04785 [Candidatus Bathyarchaeota archaeon]|nr:hypothetical protein [Candidatus Bathyarchaeota archaeon]
MRIYITHCCAKKDDTLKNSGKKVTPDELYTATPTKRFMEECKRKKVKWAIFSDKYGVWFPEEKHEWYEKDPDAVTPEEYKHLIENFEQKLGKYDEIWFYYNPGRFHPLYGKLLKEVKIKDKITLFTHKSQITRGNDHV